MTSSGTTTPAPPLRLIVVDDHVMVREALVGLLSRQEGIVVCGEADSVDCGIALSSELRPDLVLVDLMLHGRDGLDLVRHLHAHHPETRSLVITMNEEEAFAAKALSAGASGYIMKDMLTEQIGKAIAAVRAGGTWFPGRRA